MAQCQDRVRGRRIAHDKKHRRSRDLGPRLASSPTSSLFDLSTPQRFWHSRLRNPLHQNNPREQELPVLLGGLELSFQSESRTAANRRQPMTKEPMRPQSSRSRGFAPLSGLRSGSTKGTTGILSWPISKNVSRRQMIAGAYIGVYSCRLRLSDFGPARNRTDKLGRSGRRHVTRGFGWMEGHGR